MAQGQPCKEEATAFPEAGLFIPQHSLDSLSLAPLGSLGLGD